VYKIKRVKWPPWSFNPSLVPILLQDVNGPCPLLAIVNVLLLRQAITLPLGAGEVTQVNIKALDQKSFKTKRHYVFKQLLKFLSINLGYLY
jgi:hypothetical protein